MCDGTDDETTEAGSLPTPVLNMAQHITREVNRRRNEPMVEFTITVTYDETRQIWNLKAPDGRRYRLGVVD